MKTVRVALPTKQWGSLNTKYRPASINVGDDEFTDGSVNFETNQHGVISKALGGVNYNQTPLTAAPKDQYEGVFSDGARHLLAVEGGRLSYSSGGGTFTQVTSGYSSSANFEFATYQDRIYMGNGVSKEVYDRSTSYGGVTYTAPKTKEMGCQVPATAPVYDTTGTGDVADGTYYYKVTHLYYGFEESNGSAASSAVTVSGGPKSVKLKTIPTGGYGVTARYIYRSADGTTYRYVGEIADNTTTTFEDTVASGDELIPEDNGLPPVFSLIINHKERNWMGGVPGAATKAYYTEAGFPDIVASDNFVQCNPSDPITGFVVFYDRVLVFNRRSVGQIVGDTPDTYAYQALPGNVGCVDNRTINVRVIDGVPSLIWLSDKGFYEFNGATINYISNKIEDLVNFNIQQALQVKGQNAQSSQTDFQGGTASGGIDLTTVPGSITTKAPQRTWQVKADWDGGSSVTNVATSAVTNAITVPTRYAPTYATGTFSGDAYTTVGVLTLPLATNNTGGGSLGTGSPNTANVYSRIARNVAIPRSGTIGTLSATVTMYSSTSAFTLAVWADSAGAPGALLGETPVISGIPPPYPAVVNVSGLVNVPITGPTSVWIGFRGVGYNFGGSSAISTGLNLFSSTIATVYEKSTGGFVAFAGAEPRLAWTFNQTAVAKSGQWLSETYDCGSTTTDGTLTFSNASTLPSPSTLETILEASPDATTWTVLKNATNLNGSTTTSIAAGSAYRYFRFRLKLATADDRVQPTVGKPQLKFATTATWISEEIDCTSDVSAYVSAVMASTTPTGTTATLTVASSTTSGGSYSAFAVLGSTPLRRYVKFQIVLTSDSDNILTASATSLAFKYTIVANLVSSVIDCSTTPPGWDLFQSASSANGGTIVWELKTAGSSGALPGTSYTAVVPGEFPPLTTARYAQWRVTITSDAGHVPAVESVTLNWFIAQIASIRAASLFHNNTYFLAVATTGQTANNLVLEYDWQNNWRKRDDLSISTLGFFFNDPYYGSAAAGQFVRWQTGATNADGTNVALDVRTKAYDFGDSTRRKVLRKVFTTLGGTGATWTIDYSTDSGQTWLPLYDATGATSYTTPSTGEPAQHRWVPASANLTGTPYIILRARSSDANEAELHEIHLDVVVRQGEILV